MKKLHLLSAVFLAGILFAGCSQKDDLQVQDESVSLKSASLAGKYIVVLKEDVGVSKADLQTRKSKVQEKAAQLLKKYEIAGDIEEVYETALQGFTVKMAPGQAKKLGEDSNIKFIEADQIVALSPIEMNGKPGGGTAPPKDWGIVRVGGGQTYSGLNKAWIIDTGIDLDHSDLNVSNSLGWNFVSGTQFADDDNGHGTHCAGIIGAKNNTYGATGVAANALVIPVKVLNRQGSGAYSIIIDGVNYVAVNGSPGDVANMSLGGTKSDALNIAVSNAASEKGILFSLAAGNEGVNASTKSPASAEGTNIYTISAMDNADKFAYFSNYGNPPVDYCAPGVSIYSTWKDGSYNTISGTSMAAPHVAGLLLWGSVKIDKYVIGDRDKTPDPIAHR